MRIVQLVHDFLPEHVGGTEVHTLQLARELASRGHELVILCTERDTSAREGSVREREHAGLRVLELVHARDWADARETWEEPLGAAALASLLPELRPDVVHVQHTFYWGARALELARRAGAATVLTLHDYHPLCARATLLDPEGGLCAPADAPDCTRCLAHLSFEPARWSAREPGERARLAQRERVAYHRRALEWAERVIVPSRTLAAAMLEAGLVRAERLVQLDLGYPGPLRPPRMRAAHLPLRVGFLGGVLPAKGVHVLVEAMQALRGEPLELHVHGPLEWFPDYVASLRARAEGLPIQFHGRYAPERTDAVLADLDVLVLPSLWPENRPLVLTEARRNGLVVVATDLGGMRELVQHEHDGLLFPRGDARALASALLRLLRDPELYDRMAAARPPLSSPEEVAAAVDDLYRELLHQQKSSRRVT